PVIEPEGRIEAGFRRGLPVGGGEDAGERLRAAGDAAAEGAGVLVGLPAKQPEIGAEGELERVADFPADGEGPADALAGDVELIQSDGFRGARDIDRGEGGAEPAALVVAEKLPGKAGIVGGDTQRGIDGFGAVEGERGAVVTA